MECVNDRFCSHLPHMESVHTHSHPSPPPPHPFMEMGWIKERVLGAGSYGVVYLAVPVNPALPFLAMKSARLEDASSLEKERRILQNLGGSSEIVSCFGGEISLENAPGLVYNLLLEYAPGGTLADLIVRSRGGSLREGEIKRYTRAILKGLCSIHANGYVHCDLKPENILVFPSQEGINQVKIADFGLAKEPLEQLGHGNRYKYRFRGTPIYMSPESVAEGEIEAPLDVWSLGCIVVEMFTGKPALQCFDAETLMFELAVMKATPIIPENMSAEGKDFLIKCFATNPRERWTAKMLLNHPYILDDVQTTITVPLPAERTVEKSLESPLYSLRLPPWCDFSSLDLYPELAASSKCSAAGVEIMI